MNVDKNQLFQLFFVLLARAEREKSPSTFQLTVWTMGEFFFCKEEKNGSNYLVHIIIIFGIQVHFHTRL